ncbi:hypothetical protein KUTeg_002652, partial [Tegillarca granosa]
GYNAYIYHTSGQIKNIGGSGHSPKNIRYFTCDQTNTTATVNKKVLVERVFHNQNKESFKPIFVSIVWDWSEAHGNFSLKKMCTNANHMNNLNNTNESACAVPFSSTHKKGGRNKSVTPTNYFEVQ